MAASDPSNFLPGPLTPQTQADIRLRHAMVGPRSIDYVDRYSLLTDNSRLRERIEGGAPSAPSNADTGGGSSSYSFGGGETSTDPGGYNWDTLSRNLDRISGVGWGAVDYRMQNKRIAAAKQQQNAQNKLNTFANNAITTSQNIAAAMQAKSSKLTPGASMPINSPRPTTVNLLGKPGKAPTNSKQRNQNQTTKRKSSAPPLNTQTAP